MSDSSVRILHLLSLLTARFEWPGSELADELGISTRTLRRDIDTLRGLGYPVHASKGPGGAYRLGAGGKLPPLVLDDDQAIAIALALQTAPATVRGIDDALVRALTTLRQVMPVRLRLLTEVLDVVSLRNYWEFSAPPVEVKTLQSVGAAIHSRRVLRFEYEQEDRDISAGPWFGAPCEVEPHHLTVWAGRWYLVARDRGRDSWGTYRLDRMIPRASFGPAFVPRSLSQDDVSRLVVQNPDRGDIVGQWPCVGAATLRLPAQVVARWAPGNSVVTAIDSERCRLTIGAWSWAGVAGLFLTFDVGLTDTSPREFTQALATIHDRLAVPFQEMSMPVEDVTGP